VGRRGECNEREKEEQSDTEKLKRRNQVAATKLRAGYSRATHRNKMEGNPDLSINELMITP
jgi:hypothetical protein